MVVLENGKVKSKTVNGELVAIEEGKSKKKVRYLFDAQPDPFLSGVVQLSMGHLQPLWYDRHCHFFFSSHSRTEEYLLEALSSTSPCL